MPGLNFLAAGPVLLKHPHENCQNVLEFQSQVCSYHIIFEGSLANKFCFKALKTQLPMAR